METKRISTKEIIGYLAEKFPACFSVEGQAKPLKVGIFQDLAEKLADDDTVSKTRLRQALRHYTSSWRYLKVVKKGSFRVDIDGNDVSEIDAEQAEYAAKVLKESQEKFSHKKAQDKADKKPYKSTKDDSKQSSAKVDKEKFKAVKAKKSVTKKPAIELKPLSDDQVTIGSNVKVKLGNAPMDATITEISGKDVSVRLASGMVVKTQVNKIFSE